MKYRALVSFAGKISMAKGQIREISNEELISDLFKAKYIEEVKEAIKEVVKTEEASQVKKAKSKK